ncbi:MAG: UDP-N-acetylglucosamine 1-carboxyvinyltransferase [Chloroflexi bacterium RBG_16_68_14]|nr:MAG: UDP-N-acetylglucosamine 1-carboxyvinyltransferase [Chloroflexi bacterium RBG_16_68_14]
MTAGRFIIEGGRPLRGRVRVSGNKNAADYAMAAALLAADDCVLENVPDIEDVSYMGAILQQLGAEVEQIGPSRLRINAAKISSFSAPSDLVVNLRASFLVMGALLTRFGRAACCPPGGDVIGQRPLDVHLAGFRALGAEVYRRGDQLVAEADPSTSLRAGRLRGARVVLDYPSVMGTVNVMLAATMAEGATTIINAAAEPEVVSLAEMLSRMGAKVRGAGGHTIEVEGVPELHGTTQRILPDRMEAGTYALAVAVTGGEAEVLEAVPEHLDALIWKLQEAGVRIRPVEGGLLVTGVDSYRAVTAQAVPYPGLATDLHPPLAAFLTQAKGVSVIHERVYDNRLLYISELRKMGADVVTAGQTAIVSGPTHLYGTPVRCMDVRAGAALVVAALAAEGRTEINDIYHLDRGYEALEEKLRSLGAEIQRV